MKTNKIAVKCKDYIKMLSPAKTERFVWHITWKEVRLSIALDGILPIHGLSFANNQNKCTRHMWHWDIEDMYYTKEDEVSEEIRNSVSREELFEKYVIGARRYLDFWRIDTHNAGAKWYYDPNFEHYKNWNEYVCTPDAIPKSAIQLFNYDAEMYNRLYINKGDGVVNVNLNLLPLKKVDCLKILNEDRKKDEYNKRIGMEVIPHLFNVNPESLFLAFSKNNKQEVCESLNNHKGKENEILNWEGFLSNVRIFKMTDDSMDIILFSVSRNLFYEFYSDVFILVKNKYLSNNDINRYRIFLIQFDRSEGEEFILDVSFDRPIFKIKELSNAVFKLKMFVKDDNWCIRDIYKSIEFKMENVSLTRVNKLLKFGT